MFSSIYYNRFIQVFTAVFLRRSGDRGPEETDDMSFSAGQSLNINRLFYCWRFYGSQGIAEELQS